ncbi:hypothetical protein BH09ACT8_BH09ACT8_19650 [soil metagenome]
MYSACPANGHKPDTVLALPTRSFRTAACFVCTFGDSGEQAPRCPASLHQPPDRSPRRRVRHRHHDIPQFGRVQPVPRLTGGRERPRPPGRRARERQWSAGRQPRHPALPRPRTAGLLYVPKMSATRCLTELRPGSCERSTHSGCDFRAPRWSPRLRHCSSQRRRGPVVVGAEEPNLNPDASASPSVLGSYGSGGPIPSGPSKPLSEPSVITNVTSTTPCCMSEMTLLSQPGTVIRPSCL